MVDEEVVVKSEVPVALVKVRAPSVERLVMLRVLADRPEAKVDVPCPAETVMAPPKVEVAVEVAMTFPVRN